MTDHAFPCTVVDARGLRLTLPRPPRRLVSLVPSQTELLADLGLDDAVVGLTRFCVHPAGWKQRKAIVGGTKQVDRERLAALRPDLVLANLEENTREMVEDLEALAPVFVTDVRTVPEALAMIRTIGCLTDCAAAAEALATAIDAAFAGLPSFRPLRTAYLIWQRPWMTVGRDTFVHDVMERAGLVNVFSGRTRYPTIRLEELAAARPEVVLLASEPFPFRREDAVVMRAHLPAAHVALADGELFSWYGSRLRRTPPYLTHLRTTLDAALAPPN